MKYTFFGALAGMALALILPTWLTIVLAIGGLLWIIKEVEA